MKVCVLQPDYSTSAVDYKNYDPKRNLSSLLPNDTVDHVFLNKLTVYKQLKETVKHKYDIYVNLCEGYLEWEVPSIDVIHSLELLNLPYTGPNTILYDPSKELMKYVAYTQGVKSPNYAIIDNIDLLEEQTKSLNFPLFVKPSKSGDSLGIDDGSLVNNNVELKEKANSIIDNFGEALIEEYIDGREFTVLVVGSNESGQTFAYHPVEYIFPDGKNYKTYALKTSELHVDANVSVKDSELATEIINSGKKIFEGFGGGGYARLDFRTNQNGDLCFLEINFTCSVFYTDGFEGSADYILKLNNVGQDDFLKRIIKEGIERHFKKQKKYFIKGNSVSGYGIYASYDLDCNDVVFKGEERAQRIATKSHVEKKWKKEELDVFKRYAYPICEEVYLLWDENPINWAPQNHSCDANTAYDGLNVIATRKILKGEELTLNYKDFLDDSMEPFICQCNSKNCSGLITGINGNNINHRENLKRSR